MVVFIRTEILVLRVSGDQTSVGIKCGKKVFIQSSTGVRKNTTHKCASSFHTAASYADLQAKLRQKPSRLNAAEAVLQGSKQTPSTYTEFSRHKMIQGENVGVLVWHLLLNYVFIYRPFLFGDVPFVKSSLRHCTQQIVLELITSTCFIISLCGSMYFITLVYITPTSTVSC